MSKLRFYWECDLMLWKFNRIVDVKKFLREICGGNDTFFEIIFILWFGNSGMELELKMRLLSSLPIINLNNFTKVEARQRSKLILKEKSLHDLPSMHDSMKFPPQNFPDRNQIFSNVQNFIFPINHKKNLSTLNSHPHRRKKSLKAFRKHLFAAHTKKSLFYS